MQPTTVTNIEMAPGEERRTIDDLFNMLFS